MFHLGRDISNLVWESSGGPPPFNLGRRILSYGNHRRNIIMFKKLKTDFVFVLLLIQKCIRTSAYKITTFYSIAHRQKDSTRSQRLVVAWNQCLHSGIQFFSDLFLSSECIFCNSKHALQRKFLWKVSAIFVGQMRLVMLLSL